MSKPFYVKITPYILYFKEERRTSKSLLTHKRSWIFKLYHIEEPLFYGLGECNILEHLSIDKNEVEGELENLSASFFSKEELTSLEKWNKFPSIKFALETCLLDWQNKGKRILYNTPFTQGFSSILINGLIWIDTINLMKTKVKEKLTSQFTCIKIKIGYHPFDEEYKFLKWMRNEYKSNETLQIRLDANGAYSVSEIYFIIDALYPLNIHSIEQPIAPTNYEVMSRLCKNSPIPIALDEELIGILDYQTKKELLQKIKPQYIVLKPSLLGGLKEAEEWKHIAKKLNIGYWTTSALESNIGLNAIAQWTSQEETNFPQGLGTGSLFKNNVVSPLYLKQNKLFLNPIYILHRSLNICY